MSHHGHHHAHYGHHHGAGSDVASGERRLVAGILLNLAITVAQMVGGLVSGSLALLADALHNFSDTASLGISFVARRISRRRADRQRTFGYERAEIIGAFINLITLVLLAFFLLKEAVERYLHPTAVDGQVMLVVGGIALVANLATAVLLHQGAQESLNLRSAFVHITSDALASVAVLVGGVVISRYGFVLIDPLLTAAIALYILVESYQMLRQTIDILMESAPQGFDFERLVRMVQEIDGVRDIHHIHLWRLDESRLALEAHVSLEPDHLDHMERIKRSIKERLEAQFSIGHATLEFELIPCGSDAGEGCYGHEAAHHGHTH